MGKIGNSIRYPIGFVHGVIALVLIAALMTACGGGDGGGAGGSASAAEAGIFVDSTVEGLEYETPTYSGVTDKSGTYKYAEGETVSFFIGDLFIGEAGTKAVISPLDLVPDAVNETHPAVINIARLLQTMDWDGNSDNGITITALARKTLTGVYSINFDQSTDDFSNDPNVQALLDDLNNADVFGMEKRMLNDADSAMSHLQHTLQEHPSITIKAPNGGEALMAEDDCEITWKAVSFITNVAILVSTDGGVTWNEPPITDSTPNDGSYTWDAVPFTLKSTQCRFRIADADAIAENESIATASANVIHDDTDNDFTIHLTKGKVMELIQTSTAEDSDNDYLPDDVEELLGTDPDNRDSDQDGIFDYNEVFPNSSYSDDDLIIDQDNDGLIAALDADEDGDDVIDGLTIDTDGDGISNFLEYYGYTYDWFSDNYAIWDGVSYGVTYFKTDPLQPSTDQDPYSDAMEASGRLMDVLITSPGDLPMVPAYPNIVVRLEGYDVTLNEDITYAEGGSLAKERNWSRETTVENAFELGLNWEVGATGKIALEEWAEFSASIGGSMSFSHSTGSSRSTGGSVTDESNWQKAVSANPSEAARIKLKLKVYNIGTSAASNIIPTITMKIGGMSVLTFKPANPINVLEPGGVYPAQVGTYWVVDKTDASESIYLTLDELRALECGAPINIALTQLNGDVMLMNDSGQWESAGDWSQYIARCESVCANIKLDLGDGNLVHHLVFADDAPTAPKVTLGDALSWIAAYDQNSDDPRITHLDSSGLPQYTSLSDWNFIFDKKTLDDNDITPGTAPVDPDFAITDIVLGPDTAITARRPREALGLAAPEIYYAYFDVKENLIKVSAGDYNGIAAAEFIDHCDRHHPMSEVLPGSGMFLFDTSDLKECDEDEETAFEPVYADNEGNLLESVQAKSNDGISSEPRYLTATYVPERDPGLLRIIGVSIKPRAGSVDVTLEFDPYFPPSSVYFIHPDLDGETHDLTKHEMYWHKGYWNHWTGSLPSDWKISAAQLAGMWIVAEVASVDCDIDQTTANSQSSTCFASYIVQASDVREEGCDSGTLNLSGYWTNVANVAQNANYYVVDFVSDSAAATCQTQVDYIQGDEVLWSGHDYAEKYDLAILPQGILVYLVARHGYLEIMDQVFEKIDKKYIKEKLTGADLDEGIIYSHSGPLVGGYNDQPQGVWILKAGPGGNVYVVVRIKWVSGVSYTVHTRHHAEISYVVYDLDAVNDAPTATNLTSTSAYNEGDAEVDITNIVVSDVDTGETITATLTLADTSTGSLSAKDGAIYDGGTGVWTIRGSVANVNLALANLVFNPLSNNDVDTTISVSIDDGDEDLSGPLTGTITLDVTQ